MLSSRPVETYEERVRLKASYLRFVRVRTLARHLPPQMGPEAAPMTPLSAWRVPSDWWVASFCRRNPGFTNFTRGSTRSLGRVLAMGRHPRGPPPGYAVAKSTNLSSSGTFSGSILVTLLNVPGSASRARNPLLCPESGAGAPAASPLGFRKPGNTLSGSRLVRFRASLSVLCTFM